MDSFKEVLQEKSQRHFKNHEKKQKWELEVRTAALQKQPKEKKRKNTQIIC